MNSSSFRSASRIYRHRSFTVGSSPSIYTIFAISQQKAESASKVTRGWDLGHHGSILAFGARRSAFDLLPEIRGVKKQLGARLYGQLFIRTGPKELNISPLLK